MSRPYLLILLILPFLSLPQTGISQSIRDSNGRLIAKIENSEIRDHNSRKMGSISNDGTVRNSNGKKLGTIMDGGVLDEYGHTLYKYDGNGAIRDRNGSLIYGIDEDVRNSSGQLLFRFEGIELTYLIGFLCYFNQ